MLSNDFDFIFCTTNQDSVIVLNRRGERRFSRSIKLGIENPADFVSGKSDLASARLLGYKNNKMYMQFLQTGFVDSITLNTNYSGENHILVKCTKRQVNGG